MKPTVHLPARIGALLLVASVSGITPVLADELAITGPVSGASGGDGVFGWQFTPVVPIRVTALGLFDAPNLAGTQFADGLMESHRINLWDVTRPANPLVSVVLGAGTSGTVTSPYRFESIPEVVLESGRNYVIGASFTASDPLKMDYLAAAVGGAGNLTSPFIQFAGYRFGSPGSANAIPFPANFRPGDLMAFGPNFTFQFIPEPSTWALAIVGTTFLAAAGTRRRRP
jgi:hypothetical protein